VLVLVLFIFVFFRLPAKKPSRLEEHDPRLPNTPPPRPRHSISNPFAISSPPTLAIFHLVKQFLRLITYVMSMFHVCQQFTSPLNTHNAYSTSDEDAHNAAFSPGILC
jgi:hypothetical protein